MSSKTPVIPIDVCVEVGSSAAQDIGENSINHYIVATIKTPEFPQDAETRNPIDLIACVDYSTSFLFSLTISDSYFMLF